MKKIILASIVFSSLSANAFAKAADEFFFQPAVTIEYSAPALSNGVSKKFTSNNFSKQLNGFENIAIGANVRVHKFLGFNANWFQGALHGHETQGTGYLHNQARYKFDQVNLSTLLYFPLMREVELFAEAGVADINAKFNYIANNGTVVHQTSHKLKNFYGLGFQFKLCKDSQDAIRLSYQKYSGKLALLDANYATVRIGYVKAF